MSHSKTTPHNQTKQPKETNMNDRYPAEDMTTEYGYEQDDGTMPVNVEKLSEGVVGRRIIDAREEFREWKHPDYGFDERGTVLVLTLDNGREVLLSDTSDCCAMTELQGFWRDPSSVDHVILGVGATEGYTKWHIYADFGDVMSLDVEWSAGNPFYYGYGFDIIVQPATIQGEVIQHGIEGKS